MPGWRPDTPALAFAREPAACGAGGMATYPTGDGMIMRAVCFSSGLWGHSFKLPRRPTSLLFVAGAVLVTLSVQVIAQTRTIAVDASAVTGVIRPLQGLNNGPTGYHRQPVPPNSPNLIQQYRDIGIDTVRTHDSGSDVNAWIPATGLSGDSNGARESMFPKWDADPYAVDSYDFRRSDQVVNSIVAAGAEPYFRLGSDHDPRPPADFDKYAEICKHVVMHYNGGWARGYHYNIRYWEFWNEPNLSLDWEPFTKDNRTEWLGSPEQFFQLYAKVARAIVAYDPNLKIGTGAIAEGGRRSVYREQLMEYCAKNRCRWISIPGTIITTTPRIPTTWSESPGRSDCCSTAMGYDGPRATLTNGI